MEGLSTKRISLHPSDAVKIAWVHLDLYTSHWTRSVYFDINEETLCYNMMDEIIFVSQTAMQQFCRLFPMVTTRKQVIYNLFDKKNIILKSKLTRAGIKKEKLTLCTIGRLEHVKGHGRLISIIDRLKKDGLDFQLWIIGEGSQEIVIKGLISKYNLENVVFLLGFIKNPYPLLKSSDIFISVSKVEGLPLVIGEAMCLGKPIVATKVSGVIDMLNHGKYGMLVDMDDDSIYNGLKEMITNESLRTMYAKKALAGIKTDIFNIQKNIRKINNLLYHSLTEKKTPIQQIAQNLIFDNAMNNDIGIIYGKMGKAIFFFHYYQYTANEIYENYAVQLIEEIKRKINRKTSVYYECGLAGIGVGFEYLAQNLFIINNTNDLLADFDTLIYGAMFDDPCQNFNISNGFMGLARYWMYRLQNKNNAISCKEELIIKALDHVFSVINSLILSEMHNNELINIYRFLFDMKHFPRYIPHIEEFFEKKDLGHYIGNVFSKFSYLDDSSVSTFIKEQLNLKYFDTPIDSQPPKVEINIDRKPFLINGIISEGLYYLSSQDNNFQWINLL